MRACPDRGRVGSPCPEILLEELDIAPHDPLEHDDGEPRALPLARAAAGGELGCLDHGPGLGVLIAMGSRSVECD